MKYGVYIYYSHLYRTTRLPILKTIPTGKEFKEALELASTARHELSKNYGNIFKLALGKMDQKYVRYWIGNTSNGTIEVFIMRES